MPSSGETNGSSIPIEGSTLKQAIQRGLDVLGAGTADSVVEDLKRQGVDLDSQSSNYTLQQIEQGVATIFGDATPLLMKRIRQALKE